MLRWALRLFRREWRQQLLVLALLSVAVAAAVAGSAVAVNAASDSAGRYGKANAAVHLEAGDAAQALAGIDAARVRFGPLEVIAHTTVVPPGSIRPIDVRDQSPSGLYGSPMLALRDGRYPTSAGEVALTKTAAELFGATLGARISVGGESLTLVGLVENPADLRDSFVLVSPGSLAAPRTYALLIHLDSLPGVLPAGGLNGVPLRIDRVESAKKAVAATVLAASTLAMSLVGLIAASGFVVIAQRRQRQLGLLAANGASDRHVRLVMIANGVIVGIVAALVGLGVGLGGWLLAAPAVESAANHRIDRFDVPWTLIGLVVVLAIVVATAAAWWPARTVSRLPVMAALSGRPARPKPVRRSIFVAVVVLAAGLGGIAAAQATSKHVHPYFLIPGLFGVVFATVFAAPAAVRSLGAIARRLPVAPRIAMRELARYQSRAAASLAAVGLGLGIAVGVVGVASASVDRSDVGNLSSHELLVQVGDPHTGIDPNQTDADRAQLDQQTATIVASLGVGTSAVPLDVAFNSDRSASTTAPEPISLGIQTGPHSLQFDSFPYVATPQVLTKYGLGDLTIDPSIDVLTSRVVSLLLVDTSHRPDLSGTASQRVDLPTYRSAPHSLVTSAAMQRYGWVPVRAAWIVESPKALTSAEIRAARSAAATVGLAVEVRSQQDGLATLRNGATAVGSVLALAIVAMAVGLIRGEAVRDLRTLTAVGAAPATRRALTATTAATLAVLGVLIGMSAAYAALVAAYHARLGKLVPVPVANLASLAFGLPLAAAIAGWLLAGKEPSGFSRQALE